MTTLDEIAEEVKGAGSKTYLAWELRDAYPADRLGRLVRENISDQLQGLGIGHWPTEIPQYQEENVRLYHMGTRTAGLIEAVVTPSVAGDDLISGSVAGESEDLIDKIREIVCE